MLIRDSLDAGASVKKMVNLGRSSNSFLSGSASVSGRSSNTSEHGVWNTGAGRSEILDLTIRQLNRILTREDGEVQ